MRGQCWRAGILLGLLSASPVLAAERDAAVTEVTFIAAGDGSAARVSVLEGRTGPAGTRFRVADTALLEPVSITVSSSSPDAPLLLRVVKDDWDAALREAQAGPDGATLGFRTYDGFGLEVRAEVPAGYRIEIRIDPEQAADLAPAVVPASQYRDGAGNAAGDAVSDAGRSRRTIVAAGALLALGALVFGLKRKRQRRNEGAA